MQKALAASAPEIVPRLFEAIRMGTIKGDKDLIREGLKVFGLVQTGNGIAVNIMNNNNASANASVSAAGGRGFDQVIRALSSKGQVIEAE
jgi:hypothetical protein